MLQIHLLIMSLFFLVSCEKINKEPYPNPTTLNPEIEKLFNSSKKEFNRQDTEMIGTIIFSADVKSGGIFQSVRLHRSKDMQTTGWDGQYAIVGIDEKGNQLFQNWFGLDFTSFAHTDKGYKKTDGPFTFVTMKVPNYRTLRYIGIKSKNKIIMTFDLKTDLKDDFNSKDKIKWKYQD